MAEQVITRIAGAYMRREDESEFKYYKFCSLSNEAMIKSGASYTENPIKGHTNGYNFGSDFRGQYPHDSITPKYKYYLKNGNYLEIIITQILDPIPETMGLKRAYVLCYFYYVNTSESYKNGNIGIITIVDDLYNYDFQVGSFINSYNSFYGEGMGSLQSLYKYSTNQGTISPNLYIPSIAGFWKISGTQRIPEHTLEDGTVIPSHLGFDVFDWAGESAVISSDPYEPGREDDDDEPEGGDGDFDKDNDPIDFPDLPSVNVISSGFVNLFHPNVADLEIFSSYLWSSAFDIDNFKKLFANPMDCVLGLSLVPVTIPDGTLSKVYLGNINTNIYIHRVGQQYVEVDCGILDLKEYWGAYLDYAPYTKIQLWLPYIGYIHLNTDDVMNKKIHIKYHVDILSGSCCAYIKCGDSVLYSYTGQCSISIPVNGINYTQMITSVINGCIKTGVGLATGNPVIAGANFTSSVSNIISSKPTVERSGTISSMGGMLGIQKPYIIIERPRQCLPRKQNSFSGYPSFTTVKLNTINGYTEIFSIHLKNINASEEELDEIRDLLKGGVII